MTSKVMLNDEVVKSFSIKKTFDTSRVRDMCFSDTGELLVTSTEDESIIIYNCLTARLLYILLSMLGLYINIIIIIIY